MPPATQTESRLALSDERAWELATTYGTPLYVLDEGLFRKRIREYRAALQASWPTTDLTFASKANSTLAVLAIAHSEGCLIDAASEGELRAAMAAGVPASRCHLHGNNKIEAELRFGIGEGVGQIVVDNFAEIETLGRLSAESEGALPDLMLRLAPGAEPKTHEKISTGQADTKFGFNIADGSAERALLRCLELGLPVKGFLCHVGSQLFDPEAQRTGGRALATFASDMRARHGFAASEINVGGGLGVRYTDSDPEPMPVERYCQFVADAVREGLGESGLEPKLTQEPGRSLIAASGATLYTIGAVKTVPIGEGETRTYVIVDGGLSDNPRPALYDARYSLGLIPGNTNPTPIHGNSSAGALSRGPSSPIFARAKTREGGTVTVAGKHCESDVLFRDVVIGKAPTEGDLLQVLCTGAYNSSMASNYNRYPRPATVLLRAGGGVDLIQERDTWIEIFARERLPKGLGAP